MSNHSLIVKKIPMSMTNKYRTHIPQTNPLHPQEVSQTTSTYVLDSNNADNKSSVLFFILSLIHDIRISRQIEHKYMLSKATSSLFLSEMIARPEMTVSTASQNKDQPNTKSSQISGTRINHKSTTAEPPP